MSVHAIAGRYAKALIQLGVEERAVDSYQSALTGFDSMLAANPELRAIFMNPAYTAETKQGILQDLIARLSVPTTVANFLLLLAGRKRLDCLSAIIARFSTLADEQAGVVRPTLVSAMPLAESQVEEIKKSLEKLTGKKVVLTVEIDPSLIGGVITKIGDRVFDGSVQTQLTKIQEILQKG